MTTLDDQTVAVLKNYKVSDAKLEAMSQEEATQFIIDKVNVNKKCVGTKTAQPGTGDNETVNTDASARKAIMEAMNIKESGCPRCGFNPNVDDLPELPTEEDKQKYLAAAITSARFMKSYELFGGRILVSLVARTTSENNDIISQLSSDVARGRIPNDDLSFMSLMQKYQLVYSLESTTIDGVTSEYNTYDEYILLAKEHLNDELPAASNNAVIKPDTLLYFAVNNIFNSWGPILIPILNCLEHFNSLVFYLSSKAFEPDFWNGIA